MPVEVIEVEWGGGHPHDLGPHLGIATDESLGFTRLHEVGFIHEDELGGVEWLALTTDGASDLRLDGAQLDHLMLPFQFRERGGTDSIGDLGLIEHLHRLLEEEPPIGEHEDRESLFNTPTSKGDLHGGLACSRGGGETDRLGVVPESLQHPRDTTELMGPGGARE